MRKTTKVICEESPNLKEAYASLFTTQDLEKISFGELYDRIETALEVELWDIAGVYCDEIFRRNPRDSFVYLYRLMIDLRVYKTKELINLNNPFEENENYQLFLRFADEETKAVIVSYNEEIKKRREYAKKEKAYTEACIRYQYATTEADYKNLTNVFEKLGSFEQATWYRAECLRKAQNIKTRKRIWKTVKLSVVIAIIVGIVLAIFIGKEVKKNKYAVSKISVSIIGEEKKYNPNESPYINGCYYIYYDFQLENGTGVDVDYMEVTVYFSDVGGKVLGNIKTSFGGYYSSSMNLLSGGVQTYEIYISENQPEKNEFFTTLYNLKFSDFVITYKITSVSFSDGENYFSD
ncbi:MAG: hypothetical protein IJB34_00160 [Clostridia bacterium]|nr:hypothetical protein [Clostridia bacterium]